MTTTTNNASVEAANELDRITNVLTSYDVAPKLGSDEGADGWVPGDPLWKKPRKGYPGQQWTRPVFELFDERDSDNLLRVPAESHDGTVTEWWWYPTCETCEVSWEGDGPCWVCGVEPRREPDWWATPAYRPTAPASAGTHRVEPRREPRINDVCAPTVSEIESAEPVLRWSEPSPEAVVEFRRLLDTGQVTYRGATTGRLQRRTEPSALDELMTAAAMPPLDAYQRAFLNLWSSGRDPRWETVTGGVTYDDLRPGVPKVTIELETETGDKAGVTFYVDERQDFARAMRHAIKRLDMEMAYSAFRPRHVEGMPSDG